MTVRVVTDSSADLDRAVADKHAVAVVPLKVRFGEEEFTDGVDLSREEFWKRLRETNVLPHTTSPSPGDFDQAFSQLDAEGASGIVCVTLSSKVSATHQSARLAAERFRGRCRVAVVDSLSVSAGLGNLCQAAAERAEAGEDLETVVAETERLRDSIAYYGAVESLEFLRRGGRIGAARALLGSALSIRPLLSFEQGTVEVAGKVRTRQRSLEWIVQCVAADSPVESVTALHTIAADIDELHEMLASQVPGQQVVVSLVGPVMGTFLGPGCVGVTYFRTTTPD